MPSITDISDYTDRNGKAVIRFASNYVNDRNKAGRKMSEQWADMTMANIRELWADGTWRKYRTALGTFEWREHEFDYFLASLMMEPRDVANTIRNGSIPDWAELVNSINPGTGKLGKTRRPIADVVAQIRQGIPGGHGDPDVWVRHAAAGFGDRNDQMIAKSPTKVRQAVKAGNVTAIKKGPQARINMCRARDESITIDQQRAEMLLDFLHTHPAVAAIVKKGL